MQYPFLGFMQPKELMWHIVVRLLATTFNVWAISLMLGVFKLRGVKLHRYNIVFNLLLRFFCALVHGGR